jgi:hypothetical protein
VYWVSIFCLFLLPYVYCFALSLSLSVCVCVCVCVCLLLSYILQLPDCWLEVRVRKVLRPATSPQVFSVVAINSKWSFMSYNKSDRSSAYRQRVAVQVSVVILVTTPRGAFPGRTVLS